MSHIEKAVKLIGGQTKTGKYLDVSQQSVSKWVNVFGQAPAKYIRQISLLTQGKITINELLADHEGEL